MWVSVTGKGDSESQGARPRDVIYIFKRPLGLWLWSGGTWRAVGQGVQGGDPRKRAGREKVTCIQVVAPEAARGTDVFRKWR